jgi:hypothetical protein
VSSCEREIERVCGAAWGQLTRDVRQVGKRTKSCATAFVREYPMLTVAASVGLGVVLVRRLRPNPNSKPPEPKKPARLKHRAAWLPAISGMLGNALWDWAMRSMSTPRPPTVGSPPSPYRN